MLPRAGRLLVAGASCLVLAALVTPLWRVRLIAPQYPEGLGMMIHAGSVRGATENDLHSINTLNHYIGMRAIEPDEIAALRVMPWCIVGLSAAGLAVALMGRRAAVIGWLAAFALLGARGLWELYRWEYTYGHDLDLAHAIIKVPGMSYQPPLIGSKQLLNVTASSWPGVGSMCLGAAFALGVAALVVHRRRAPTLDVS